MKILIRNKSTGAFFKAGDWVTDHRQAQEITSVSEACELRKLYRLKQAQLYFLFREELSVETDVVVDLNGLKHDEDEPVADA